MDVQIHQAALTVEGKTVKLTKSIAMQFPIRSGVKRWDAIAKGEGVPQPICKVAGKTLRDVSQWLYLTEDAEAGLVWVPPALFYPALTERLQTRGVEVDDPAKVPTLIL